MGFKAVFASLQDIFPQIDLRILKAVALEHPNDIDAAAESILVEILPSIPTSHELSSTLQDANEVVRVSTSAEKGKQPMFYEHQEEEGTSNHLSGKEPVVWENTISSCGSTSASANTGSSCIMETDARDSRVSLASYSKEQEHPTSDIDAFKELNTNSSSEGNVKEKGLDLDLGGFLPLNQLFVDALFDIDQEDIVPLASFNQADECPLDQSIIQPSIENSHTEADGIHDNNRTLCNQDSSISASFSYDQHPELRSLDIDLNSMAKDKIMCGGSYSLNGSMEQSFHVEPLNAQNFSELELDDAVVDCIASGAGVKVCEVENSEGYPVSKFATVTSAFGNTLSKISYENGLVPNKDSLPATLITRSGHFVDIEFLEAMISDAKGKKESLLSTVEITRNLMRDVELLEDRSKHAKEVASNAGQDILSKAEELKAMEVPAKEENDKLAGVIRGEKAILATEAQELHSRLLSLSNERNKSLSAIEEIRETLEAGIAAMKEEIAAFEQEKLEKEATARRVLNEQEAIMASIVEESKKLQEEAEKNAKLREFLMDRGCMVDALQGEIAIICEDVMLLKQIVDSGLPSGRSLLGAPASLSASSSSSHGGSKHSSSDVPVLELEDSTEDLSVHDNITATPSSEEPAKYGLEQPLQSSPLLVPTTMASVVCARTLMTSLVRRSSLIANTASRALSVSVQAPALPNSSLYKRGAAPLVAQPVRLPFKNHVSSLSARYFSALSPEMKSTLDKLIQSHKVVLFMKGTKDFPQCGFSNAVVQILKTLNVPFETVNILGDNTYLREGMKEYSSWPTFPQLYIDGEFYGGCDITVEKFKSGELQERLEKALSS